MTIPIPVAFVLMAVTTASLIALCFAELATAPKRPVAICQELPRPSAFTENLSHGSRGPSRDGKKWTAAQLGQAANAE